MLPYWWRLRSVGGVTVRTDADELREADPGSCPHCNAPLEIIAVKFRLLGPARTLYGCQQCALATGKSSTPKRKRSRAEAVSLSLGVQKIQLRLKKIPVKRS
jgi:hypothetical protein